MPQELDTPNKILESHIQAIRPFLRNIIYNTKDITVSQLYGRAKELHLGHENEIRSTFLDILATDGLSLDSNYKIHKPSPQEE